MWPFSSPATEPSTSASNGPAQCPVDHSQQHRPQSSSRLSSTLADPSRLPTDRVTSSIPRYRSDPNPAQAPSNPSSPSGSDTRASCPVGHSTSADSQQNWVYPSPSQFYQALTRKQRSPRADDMYTVVPIHNAVNERVWRQVLEWEANYGRGAFDRWPRSGKSGPMLCSFRGRPDELSPRAWIKVLSGYQAPFDRHDWEVIRPTEERMRYVIDFYPGKGSDSSPTSTSTGLATQPNLSFYIDVRPAIDNWEGLRMRLLKSWDEIQAAFVPKKSSDGTSTQ